MQTIDPTTGKTIRIYAEYSAAQIKQRIERAQKAFESWRNLSLSARGQKMKALARILRKNKKSYARLMAQEMGKPLTQGEGEIEKCAWVCEFYTKQAKNYLAPQVIATEARKSYVTFDPLGVILAVMPWNFPFWQVFRAAAPALMAGNTMVLKHASNVCGSALAIEKSFKEAGFPDGVLLSILISNEKVHGVIGHPAIQAVTLTGSTRAGQIIASQAGAVVKKVVLELGGSDPYIILKDADIQKAAATCAASRLINGGQSCVAAKRFIVVSPQLRKFEEHFVEAMRAQKMGSPFEKDTTLGPLARHDLRESLHAQVQESIKKGAKLLLGGTIPDLPGAFYPPTVLTNLRPGMPAYDEELFGPVASIIGVASQDEAVRVANDTPYGLGAAVFTRDIKRGEKIVSQLQAGCCFINDFVKSDPRLPFGGIKQSGYGRELSHFGMHEFVNVKTVYIK